MFRLVFALLFHQKIWFRLLEGDKSESLLGKDTVYRFLNHPSFAWRRFLTSLSVETIDKVESLTSKDRVKAFIFDDSMFDRAIAAGVSATYALMNSWFKHAPPIQEILNRGIHVLRCIQTSLATNIPAMSVFIRHRSKKNEWLAILSTELTLSSQEVIRNYKMRLDIG